MFYHAAELFGEVADGYTEFGADVVDLPDLTSVQNRKIGVHGILNVQEVTYARTVSMYTAVNEKDHRLQAWFSSR